MSGHQPIGVALVGAGEFGATFLAQARRIPELAVRLVCDRDPERAAEAARSAGYHVTHCESRAEALAAIGRGRIAVVADMALISDLPLNAVV